MNLAKEIAYLLYKHNCVIIPNFGAFLVNEKAAEFNDMAKYASPKQKLISFNSQIITNDGLLANHLSIANNYTYEEGVAAIADFVASLNTTLQEKRNTELAEIGTFYLTKEEKLIFVPYHSVNFAMESFGLPKLRLSTYRETLVEEKVQPKIEQTLPKKISKEQLPVKPKQEKKIKLQEKRFEKKIKQNKKHKAKTKLSNLSIVNVLGSLFLIGMFFALLNFEMNSTNADQFDLNYAAMLDSPISSSTKNLTPTKNNSEVQLEDAYTIPFYAIQTEMLPTEEVALELINSFNNKYSQAEIVKDENGKINVFIISFSNESLANEYKDLIQKNINQKLVITKK